MRLVLLAAFQMQLCSNTAVLTPKSIPGSQHCVQRPLCPGSAATIVSQLALPASAGFPRTVLPTLLQHFHFLRRSQQQDAMTDFTWVFMCQHSVTQKLIYPPRPPGNTVQRSMHWLCSLLAWGQRPAGTQDLAHWCGSVLYAAGCL